MKLKTNLMSRVLVCVAIAGVTSMASAVVQFGVVGSGIHVQFGPQDANGNYLGIVSESYDAYIDSGWWDIFPAGVSTAPNGEMGYVLLALNPYTGEVWTDIPEEHRAYGPNSTYSGHEPTVMISGPSGLPDDPETPDVDESLLYSDYITNMTPSPTGYTDDCIYVTAQAIPGIQWNGGSYVSTSPDGGILADPYYWPDPADPIYMTEGQEVAEGGGAVFLQDVIGRMCAFDELGWRGGWGSYVGTLGFEIDGIKGWIRFNYSGHRSGVRLTEYYFDVPMPPLGSFDGDMDVDDLDIDLLCDAIRTGSTNFALFDISADGLTEGQDGAIDILDLDFLIRYLVWTTAGEGTEYGDFNLDGKIDTTDLTRLATYYGAGDTWAKGNANRYIDLITDTTDLTILATYYGFGEPDAVPEPMTLSLLALGTSGVLAHRRRRA